MDIYELQLEHSPKDKRPFTIYASSEIGLLELWFTQEQMDEIFETEPIRRRGPAEDSRLHLAGASGHEQPAEGYLLERYEAGGEASFQMKDRHLLFPPGANDEVLTPDYAVRALIPHLARSIQTVWCPFDRVKRRGTQAHLHRPPAAHVRGADHLSELRRQNHVFDRLFLPGSAATCHRVRLPSQVRQTINRKGPDPNGSQTINPRGLRG